MSNFGPLAQQQRQRAPVPPTGEPIARYATYVEAQRAVDYLSDNQFPVQFVTIVGTGLRMVEKVTGRLTYPRVALAGAASGAWFGLLIGLLLSFFAEGPPTGVLAAILFGAGFGMLFGIMSYAFTGGRRDFTSTSQIVASEYEVLCMPEQAGGARQLLAKLATEGGPRPTPGASSASMPSSGFPAQGPQSPYGGPPGPYAGPGQTLPPPPPPGSVPSPGGPPTGGSTAYSPAAGARQEEPQAPPAPVTGPTYGEMIERQRRERAERERAERERAERERADREAAERAGRGAPPE